MARAWTVALVAVLAVSLVGCLPGGGKEAEKAGTVEIRVPVAEKKPTPPTPKTPETPVVKPVVTPVVTPVVKPVVKPKPAPKPMLVELKSGTGVDLAKLFNNDAFSAEADRKDADLDQWGQSFPAEELPKAGKFCNLKELPVCFIFPTAEAKKKNNIACAGQTIPLSGKRQALHLLVTATDADQEAKLAIEFADGKVDKDLKVTDWCGKAKFGEKVAVACKSRIALVGPVNESKLDKEAKGCSIWCVTIPLDAKREVKAVKLPYNAQIHIFALSLK